MASSSSAVSSLRQLLLGYSLQSHCSDCCHCSAGAGRYQATPSQTDDQSEDGLPFYDAFRSTFAWAPFGWPLLNVSHPQRSQKVCAYCSRRPSALKRSMKLTVTTGTGEKKMSTRIAERIKIMWKCALNELKTIPNRLVIIFLFKNKNILKTFKPVLMYWQIVWAKIPLHPLKKYHLGFSEYQNVTENIVPSKILLQISILIFLIVLQCQMIL